jgi:hypothetical protein
MISLPACNNLGPWFDSRPGTRKGIIRWGSAISIHLHRNQAPPPPPKKKYNIKIISLPDLCDGQWQRRQCWAEVPPRRTPSGTSSSPGWHCSAAQSYPTQTLSPGTWRGIKQDEKKEKVVVVLSRLALLSRPELPNTDSISWNMEEVSKMRKGKRSSSSPPGCRCSAGQSYPTQTLSPGTWRK